MQVITDTYAMYISYNAHTFILPACMHLCNYACTDSARFYLPAYSGMLSVREVKLSDSYLHYRL